MVCIHKSTFACMRIRAVLVSLAIASITFIDMPSLAHGGGLNSQGCHNEKATGGHHCHRSSKSKKAKKKKNKKVKASKASKKARRKTKRKRNLAKRNQTKTSSISIKSLKDSRRKKESKTIKGLFRVATTAIHVPLQVGRRYD